MIYRVQLDKYIRDHRILADREKKFDQLEKQLQEVEKEKKDAESAVTELQQRVKSLQQELDTSEAVQKDFVRLSQSLQVNKKCKQRNKRHSKLTKKSCNKLFFLSNSLQLYYMCKIEKERLQV